MENTKQPIFAEIPRYARDKSLALSHQRLARRDAIRQTGLLGLGAVAGAMLAGGLAEAGEIKTPTQTEGPFYPVRDQLDKDSDMTKVKGRQGIAKGEIFVLSGVLKDVSTGSIIPGAMIEFWQACATGRYNHPKDPNTQAALDPDFQYWSQVTTDQNGQFSLKSIIPGAYPADSTWMRPPHIHVKVHKVGYPTLTTQIYFSGNEYNEEDKILQALTPAQQKLVMLELQGPPNPGESPLATWTVLISKFRGLSGAEELEISTPELD